MTDAEREAMLQERIVRLLVAREFDEAAELLAEHHDLRRERGALVPPEERQSPCVECCECDDCEKAWKAANATRRSRDV